MSLMTDDLAGEPQAAVATKTARKSRRTKRVMDVGIVLLSLPFLLPFLLLIAVALLVVDGRPIIFRHKRVGRNGRTFECLKFRTMRKDADKALAELLARDPARMAEWKETQKLKADPRVHLIGKYLRITSVDELPQLLNVLRGEMSLVGPRPIVPDEMERYGSRLYAYLAMKPGLTGLWQISRRAETTYDERIEMDVDYYHKCSVLTDMVIIWKTVGVVVFARNEV
jgi:exopolysaccharide production protein ExoY